MKENKTHKIAALLTCYNRREKTLNCLASLFGAFLPEDFTMEVFLVDDGSTDGTGEAVKKQYPQVNVIQGDGNLYWNQGMRLAWKEASTKDDYDFYLWLNNDTIIDENALLEMLECFWESLNEAKELAIIVGACRASDVEIEFSYGGRTDQGPLIPNGEIRQCKYINGNIVIVHRDIYNELGFLSKDYTHAMGDNDYGLRAINAGFKCYTTKSYIAVCPNDKDASSLWFNPKLPLIKRWKLMHSPRGLNVKEYILFRKKFWGNKWIIYAIKAYMKVLFPYFYSQLIGKK